MGKDKSWRLIYNPEGDTADVVAYGAAVAEGPSVQAAITIINQNIFLGPEVMGPLYHKII